MVIAAVVAGAIFSGVTSPREISPGVTVNGVKGAGPMATTAIAGALRSVLMTSAAPMTAGPGDGVEPPVAVEAVRREAVPGVDVLEVSAPFRPRWPWPRRSRGAQLGRGAPLGWGTTPV